MRVVLTRVTGFFHQYPLAKGMLAYSIMWPTGNIIQQSLTGKRWGKFFLCMFSFYCKKVGSKQFQKYDPNYNPISLIIEKNLLRKKVEFIIQ